MRAQDVRRESTTFASVYLCLCSLNRCYSFCSLNRCYFFFVLRCLSLQASGFPPECRFPQRSDCHDVTVLLKYGYDGGFVFCCYSLLLDFVHLRVGPGILHLYERTTLSDSFIVSFMGSCLHHSLEDPPFDITTPKHGIRSFVFYFEFFIAQKSSIVFGRGESE